ncbi:N-acyl amino acid synthase FeeM domain-containing protein [Aquabacterium humicola]|uniref:N-acyl amino acid synthase FeeM domain-containing protein n=1 Tax=Aquabacterium humicola TaxID=3237377 RepID=UPI0025437DE4|nr:long-chain N-acyl amino acid synthase [Rubrivivax pictus]
MKSSTIIAASLMWRRNSGNMLVENPRIDLLPDGAPGPRRFKIKVADQKGRRGLVESLLKHRYAWRGYQQVSLPTDQSVHKFTLAAMENDQSIGTITVSFDGPNRLSADDAFPEEVQALRAQGRRLCEFTKLAVDPTTATKRVLAALFHVAYIVAHRIRGHDMLLIEVNPRHVRYYERMLGLKVIGSERLNRTVRAPAVLLAVDFAYILQQIGEFGGQPDRAANERSLFPFAFSLTEEASIMGRMQAVQALREQQLAKPESEREDEHLPSDLMPG